MIVVLEASGGYEHPFLDVLEAAETRYKRVNPRHAKEFARATGRLAKTDRTDTRGLSHMGAVLGLERALCEPVVRESKTKMHEGAGELSGTRRSFTEHTQIWTSHPPHSIFRPID